MLDKNMLLDGFSLLEVDEEVKNLNFKNEKFETSCKLALLNNLQKIKLEITL